MRCSGVYTFEQHRNDSENTFAEPCGKKIKATKITLIYHICSCIGRTFSTLLSPQNLGASCTRNTFYTGLNGKFFKFRLLKTRARPTHGCVLYTSKFGIYMKEKKNIKKAIA